MNVSTVKTKRRNLGIGARLVFTLPFEFATRQSPRDFTRTLSRLVRYPKLIYDVGRSVDSGRNGDNGYRFEIRQKRYLGRGTYAISAKAIGNIAQDDDTGLSHIEGDVRFGGQYTILLTIMTLFVLLSLSLIYFTILYIPLAILMLLVLALHWAYLFADRRELLNCLDDLVNARHIEADYDINQL